MLHFALPYLIPGLIIRDSVATPLLIIADAASAAAMAVLQAFNTLYRGCLIASISRNRWRYPPRYSRSYAKAAAEHLAVI